MTMFARTLLIRSTLAAVSALTLLAGCGKSDSSSTTPAGSATTQPAAAAGPTVQVGVIAKGTTASYWKAVEAGARQAAAEDHVDIIWTGPDAETNHAQQAAMVDNMVNRGVAGIVLAPTSVDALVRPVESAVKRKIPVVLMDSTLKSDAPSSVVATDNEAAGKQAAAALNAAIGPNKKFNGQVIMLRFLEGSGSTERREKGFIEGLKAAGLHLVGDAYTKGTGSSTDAAETADALLRRHIKDHVLQVDGIFASNEPTAIGMMRKLQAFKAQGVTITAPYVGFDAAAPLIDGLRAGDIAAIVTQDPHQIGYLAVQTMDKVIKGQTVPKSIPTPTATITQANVDSPEIKAILGG
jgi:ribose transport system substrate-binding protein